jgi:hypothetical protein
MLSFANDRRAARIRWRMLCCLLALSGLPRRRQPQQQQHQGTILAVAVNAAAAAFVSKVPSCSPTQKARTAAATAPRGPAVGRPTAASWSGRQRRRRSSAVLLLRAQVSQQEAQKGIDRVVAALRKDRAASGELGRLERVTTVLGYGCPTPQCLAVRFNASFRKGGSGLSAVPLSFGLGQSSVKEGRGTMVGQVKASMDKNTGKILSVSVFRDLGYGRSFEMKV